MKFLEIMRRHVSSSLPGVGGAVGGLGLYFASIWWRDGYGAIPKAAHSTLRQTSMEFETGLLIDVYPP